ncbi:MAG: c-type cytochrome [Gallionellaceae bacterium]
MKLTHLVIVIATGLAVSTSAMGAEMPELAKKGNCVACHAMDKKMVGPSWQDVAAKYKGDKSAVASLSGKIIAGSKGIWGPTPMPPNPKITEAEAKELAKFVMSLAK